MKYQNIFSPIKIGNTVFKNRIWSAPAGVHLLYGREEYPSDAALAYYAGKAAGGAAVITYSAQNMDLEIPYDPVHACENILKPETHRFYNRFTEAIHAHDAKVSLELLAFQYHHRLENGEIVLHSVNGGYNKIMECETAAFTQTDLERIAKTYGDVAEAALKCGFDMLLIHGGHGLCLSQFYSKLMNRRTDEFSAETLENRMRFACMILDEIRARVGRRLLIEYRISGEEDPLNHNGYSIDDCIEMIKHIQDRIDIAHMSTGAFYNGTENITHPTEFLPHGCNVNYAQAVKACPDISIPVLTLGSFQEADQIEEVLSTGKADIVAMARGLISDADRVSKWRCGKEDEAIPCIRCFHCLDYERAPTFACSVNPAVGRELLQPVLQRPAGASKKVVVVGGGPAGMQAAITAAQRGHQVTLVEKEPRLGGKLIFARQVPFKHDLTRFMDWQIRMLKKLNVDVKLSFSATADSIKAMAPDAVIAAVGADPLILPIPGIGGKNVITAEQAYNRIEAGESVGQHIAVLGGGLVGCETGLFLATQAGKTVTIVEMLDEAAVEEMYLTREALLDRLAEHTTVITGAKCTAITENSLVYADKSGLEHTAPCDTVVLSSGMRPRQDLAESFRGAAPVFVSVGDCVKAANVRNATRTGYNAAVNV